MNKLTAQTTRALTNEEKDSIRANATGEHVYCGDYASALQIARDACDRSDEWSADADDLAAEIARKAWAASR